VSTPPLLDTIVAIATAPGRGGIGVIRISGPNAADIGRTLLGSLPAARRALQRPFIDAQGQAIDHGLALWFEGPRSFTGEDVLELHGHGGPVVLDLLFARVLSLGARAARPGEFSERAFLNDKIDLAQAEAIADLIDAGSVAAARAAMRSLSGEFSSRVQALTDAIVDLRVYIEASIDFAEEDIELLEEGGVRLRIATLQDDLRALQRSAEQGRRLQEGCTVVIAGRPNSGKSSLLNALAGEETAIVTATPGTTRDVLRERIDIDGLPVRLLDTAGLRDDPDPIEAEGIRRARLEIARADQVVYLVDASDPVAVSAAGEEISALGSTQGVTLVFNKADLATPNLPGSLAISARTGQGLDQLRQHLRRVLGVVGSEDAVLSARRRHLEALSRAGEALETAAERLASAAGIELIAEELKRAHDALGEITGRFTTDDLLGEIFSSFCIGK
jgi:tRNA modification GTPase